MVHMCINGEKHSWGFSQKLSEKAGLSNHFTNHSGRKTAVTKLVNENVPVNQSMQLTGQKKCKKKY